MGGCQSKNPVVESRSGMSQKGVVSADSRSPKESHPSTNKQDSDASDENSDQRTATTHISSITTTSKKGDKGIMARRGYSSGGSSDLDTSAHNQLVELKKELASNGGLSSGVVRIEVSN